MHLFRLSLLTALMAMTTSLSAEITLPNIISDNMVLQQGKELPFWGKADAGDKVTVTVGDKSASATADDSGKWSLKVPAISEFGPVDVTVSARKDKLKINNVIVGNNWICGGQSNMEWPVVRSNNPEEEIANAKYPEIRMFKAPHIVAAEPQDNVEGEWVVCSPETIASHSAVGYFFGRELLKQTGQPVGLIESNWGGTPAESWTSMDKLTSIEELQPILDRWNGIIAQHDSIMQKYNAQVEEWKVKVAEAKAAGKDEPRKPGLGYNANHPHRAASLYNGMIAPLVPFAIQGAIWYQGESNASRAYQYRTLFPAMITNWREKWGQGDFPFYFVQLANFRKVEEEPVESDWAELREAQSMTLSLPNSGQAVIIDIGEADDIHPRNKQDVGYRLAQIALHDVFGKSDVVYSGPTYKSMEVEGNKIRLQFDHIGGGLVAQGEELKGFAIAGEDKKFYWADAKIEGDSIVVSADEVSVPVAVRYAWANNPICNLYNKAGLPASPFRTDTWTGVTANNK
ncbi:MAG: sialate O-acetylesterase [Planctomycetaceae bacterium]|nr:sialate O-acetylesterase [Planctomycetaceae bacterium]